jgi:hypothetical protein
MNDTHHRTRSRSSRRRSGRALVVAGLSAAWIAGVATLLVLGSTAQAAASLG